VKRNKLRQAIRNGEDPELLRKQQKIEIIESVASTFENIAKEYMNGRKAISVPSHLFRTINRLKANIFPALGNIPIKKITTKELLAVIKAMEERRVMETARSVMQVVGQVFRGMPSLQAESSMTSRQTYAGSLNPLGINTLLIFPRESSGSF
jgi:integrase